MNYALLIKSGFRVKEGRIVNPSAVFYADRDEYYEQLSRADSLEPDDVLGWSEYFLLGLKNEIKKIDKLLGIDYVAERLLIPALSFALDSHQITDQEFSILRYIISKDGMVMKASELSEFGIFDSVDKSRTMARIRSKGLVESVEEGGRIYTIRFSNGPLLRGIMKVLEKEGFASGSLNAQ